LLEKFCMHLFLVITVKPTLHTSWYLPNFIDTMYRIISIVTLKLTDKFCDTNVLPCIYSSLAFLLLTAAALLSIINHVFVPFI